MLSLSQPADKTKTDGLLTVVQVLLSKAVSSRIITIVKHTAAREFLRTLTEEAGDGKWETSHRSEISTPLL